MAPSQLRPLSTTVVGPTAAARPATTARVNSNPGSKPILYRYNCHTCKVHFPDDSSLSAHIFGCHRPFRFGPDAAEKNSQCSSTQSSGGGGLGQGRPELPQPCTQPRCACPHFIFVAEPVTIGRGGGADDDGNSVASLDGAAGSSMAGKDPDDFNGAEEIKVSVSSGKGDREMNKRFNKGKNSLRRKVRHEGADRDLKVLRAYEDADEILFGQKRFEELKDDDGGEDIDDRTKRRNKSRPVTAEGHKALRLSAVEEKERIDLWKEESGIRNLQDEREKEAKDLAAAIDMLIADTLSEIKSKEQQKKEALLEMRKQNRLRFDDIVDDVAFDHLQEVEERRREAERKRLGAKQTRALASDLWDDIVDEFAYDHLQEVAEREEEHKRKILGRAQQQRLAAIRADDAIDQVVMDFLQENAEREAEANRKALGRKQQRELRAMEMDDIVDGMVMDHLQENAERQEESNRKALGRKQQRELHAMAMDDIVDGLVMEHLQENAERQEESNRKALGREQQRKLHAMAMDDIVDEMVVGHMQENAERQQESNRKALRRKQEREPHAVEMDDAIDGIVMDHIQGIAERDEEHKRLHAGRESSRKITKAPAETTNEELKPTNPAVVEPSTKKRRRERNPKQDEYDAMVDEMVRLQEAKKARF